MINTDRIVPVMAIDLLSLYGLILKVAGTTLTVADATDTDGNFELESAPESGSVICSEPVATFDFGEDVTVATVYFVPAYDYAGFTIDGAAATIADNDVEVEADGRTLYLATLADSTVTITQVGF